MRIEHQNVFCPVCNGHAGCLECADGRTFDAYCEVQDAHREVIERETRYAQSHQCPWPGQRGKPCRLS